MPVFRVVSVSVSVHIYLKITRQQVFKPGGPGRDRVSFRGGACPFEAGSSICASSTRPCWPLRSAECSRQSRARRARFNTRQCLPSYARSRRGVMGSLGESPPSGLRRALVGCTQIQIEISCRSRKAALFSSAIRGAVRMDADGARQVSTRTEPRHTLSPRPQQRCQSLAKRSLAPCFNPLNSKPYPQDAR